MKPTFIALLALVALRCAAVPPSLSVEQDPSNALAPEAPARTSTKTLVSDPPPPEALEDSVGAPDGGVGSGGTQHHHDAMDGGMR